MQVARQMPRTASIQPRKWPIQFHSDIHKKGTAKCNHLKPLQTLGCPRRNVGCQSFTSAAWSKTLCLVLQTPSPQIMFPQRHVQHEVLARVCRRSRVGPPCGAHQLITITSSHKSVAALSSQDTRPPHHDSNQSRLHCPIDMKVYPSKPHLALESQLRSTRALGREPSQPQQEWLICLRVPSGERESLVVDPPALLCRQSCRTELTWMPCPT